MLNTRFAASLKTLAFLFVAQVLVTIPLFGQATTGSISGRIVDPSGAAVQGASVVITDVNTGIKTSAVTGKEGEFIETALPPDNYQIAINVQGFAPTTIQTFRLDIDQRARFNVKLKLESVAASVTVTDQAPVLQTQGGETGQVIGTEEISDLPTLGRNFQSLLLLVPGVVTGGGGNNLNISVDGQREFANSVQINGVEVTSNRNNDTSVQPSPDAIQEFKVVTSSYAPEFGRSAGGDVLIQTKSGTNDIHGSAFYFYRPAATAAAGSFELPGFVPTLHQNNYGATIGGPVKKDKAFVFLAYEGYRNLAQYGYGDETLVGQNQVAFDPAGDADLSGLTDPYTGNQVPIFNPYFFENNYYTQQFAGNVIPAGLVDPGGRKIVENLFPAPESASDPYENFHASQSYGANSNEANFRTDYALSQNNKFYVTYDVEQGDYTVSDPFAGHISQQGGGGADSGGTESYENHVMAATYDHVFTPTLLNEARASYFISTIREDGLLDGTNLATQYGIQNANIQGFPSTYGFPQIQDGTGAVTGGSTYKPLAFRDVNLGFSDSVTYTRGRHNAKLGYEYRHLNSHPHYSLFPDPYEYFAGAGSNFTSDPDYGFYDPSAFYYNGGAEIADMLLGLPEVVEQGLQLTDPHTTSNEHTFYLQDYWQVTPKLNLTYGVRYEYQQPYVEASNKESNFDLSTLQIDLAGVGANSRSLVDSNTADIMPRVGFAYQIHPSLVLRGGYGIFYTPENDAREEILTENYPFYTEQYITNNAYDLSYFLSPGAPRSTTINIPSGASTIDLTSVPGASIQTVYSEPKSFPTGYSQSFNVTVQQELGNATSSELSYVGSTARSLPYKVGNYNVNNHLSSQLGVVEELQPIGISNYNSLQAKINHSFSQGYSMLISYTWSHSLDNGPAPFDLGTGNNEPQNPFDVSSEYSNSDFDVRNNLVASEVIELPVGHGKHFLRSANGVTDALIGGWQINSITTMHGGRPVNIVSNSQNTLYPGLRPDLVGNPYVGHRTIGEWFNPYAFTPPPGQAQSAVHGATVPLVVGDAPRNFIYGPGYTDEDISLFKVLSLPREKKFQIRVESFNVLNTSRYGQPDGDLAHIGTVQHPGTFGQITGSYAGANARVLQFAGRFIF